MIGLFGAQPGCRTPFTNHHSPTSTATAFKSKGHNNNSCTLLDNQINDKLKEVNNNLIKKRPHFLKFFNENFFKPNGAANGNASPDSSCKR